jgi:hypothetical protein
VIRRGIHPVIIGFAASPRAGSRAEAKSDESTDDGHGSLVISRLIITNPVGVRDTYRVSAY